MPRALTDNGRVELRLRPDDKATVTRAARWYEGYGALRLGDAPLSPGLPLTTVADAIKRGL